MITCCLRIQWWGLGKKYSFLIYFIQWNPLKQKLHQASYCTPLICGSGSMIFLYGLLCCEKWEWGLFKAMPEMEVPVRWASSRKAGRMLQRTLERKKQQQQQQTGAHLLEHVFTSGALKSPASYCWHGGTHLAKVNLPIDGSSSLALEACGAIGQGWEGSIEAACLQLSLGAPIISTGGGQSMGDFL